MASTPLSGLGSTAVSDLLGGGLEHAFPPRLSSRAQEGTDVRGCSLETGAASSHLSLGRGGGLSTSELQISALYFFSQNSARSLEVPSMSHWQSPPRRPSGSAPTIHPLDGRALSFPRQLATKLANRRSRALILDASSSGLRLLPAWELTCMASVETRMPWSEPC